VTETRKIRLSDNGHEFDADFARFLRSSASGADADLKTPKMNARRSLLPNDPGVLRDDHPGLLFTHTSPCIRPK
jgi:hypothetical protein